MAVIDYQKVGDGLLLPRVEANKRGVGDFDSYGIRQDTNWRVDYIPYMVNGINSCSIQPGWEVLSYNFTGCLFVVWEYQGIFFAGHVSTGTGQDCKPRWIAARGGFTRFAEFRPSDYVVPRQGVIIKDIYGLVSLRNNNNNICFSTIVASSDLQGNRFIDQWHMLDVEWGHTV